jgi:REP element-mobilizing transposase RayT
MFNRVRVVLESETDPVKLMNTFKTYASRRLNRIEAGRKRWVRHGSTRWLWKDQSVRDAVRYVVDDQSEAMVVFLTEDW